MEFVKGELRWKYDINLTQGQNKPTEWVSSRGGKFTKNVSFWTQKRRSNMEGCQVLSLANTRGVKAFKKVNSFECKAMKMSTSLWELYPKTRAE